MSLGGSSTLVIRYTLEGLKEGALEGQAGYLIVSLGILGF
jgi:hypothetical protein